ncbi:UDP-N-acetylmuramate--L-alanine ligase [Niabella yanshanensis]|uniref:UDP-N-acetylmuramate--L-alanine ligase n=1 Tax=Niabella yanshanensis TaxID=577386 RepID=A0ABZ0WC44_9BACT|nr:UDP-N-acetylmuramate--L-alanine ligase [Niabella yanshanensis]WQD40167.1 UDP-N-acetylmuramate--L-alanine ligase [Niabella yanshanensis]
MSAVRKHINEVQAVYFIGIGGIGMSAIARYFLSLGKKVSGYDRTETAITSQLEKEGIAIHYNEDLTLIPKEADYVVYTPAIPKDHKELVFYQNEGYAVVKRSDILQVISEGSFNICVAGTHGKTTTSTMVAHLLRHSGYGCNAFLGGISANYGTNFWSSDNNVCVIEADEYDRSFLKLSPDVAVITATDADHLDIYETEANVKDAFRQFAAKTKKGGLLLKKLGLEQEIVADRTVSYSIQDDTAEVYATNIRVHEGGYSFDAVLPGNRISDIRLNMGGMHNVENMMAAIGVASDLGIEAEKIKAAVTTFKGVKRRFEYIVNQKDLVFVDDYAHHPEELKALINGVQTLFPEKRCTLIFQPHLFTRTRDFAAGFAEVLGGVDNVVLLPIYPARELPIEGVSSNLVLDYVNAKSKALYTKEQLLDWIEADFSVNRNREQGEVIITAGAGDIDKLIEPIKQILTK